MTAPLSLVGPVPVGAPTGFWYSALLVGHLLCAVVGLVAVAVSGVEGARVARLAGADRDPWSDPVAARYFRTGPVVAGRALYGIFVFGVGLVWASAGRYRAGDLFVVAGGLVWLAGVVLAEAVVWPVERDLKAVARRAADGSAPLEHRDARCAVGGDGPRDTAALGRRLSLSAGAVGFLVVVGALLMAVKP